MENQIFQNCYPGKKILGITLSVFLIVLIVYFGVLVGNKIREGRYIGTGFNTITITETGEVYAKPDLALIDLSVVGQAKNVKDALDDNSAKMNSVIKSAKEQGVEEKDLKTTDFNIRPLYEYYDEYSNRVSYATGKRVLVGYEITQTLQVKIRDLTKVGQIIESATGKGANQVGVLQFTIDKQDEARKQAREQAIEKAKIKAKEFASQVGVKLGKITNFYESSFYPYYNYSGYGEAKEVAMAPTPQIEPGQNKITVTVGITYEIK